MCMSRASVKIELVFKDAEGFVSDGELLLTHFSAYTHDYMA